MSTLHSASPAAGMAALTVTETAPPAPGSILTGKQEHYLKRELISQQVKREMSELASPLALQRFGAPFQSSAGDVSPQDSEFPIFRYVFVNHIRRFPFIDQAKEKEFWQDKLQVFLESFASKRISSSEDRLEMTKRRKLALKAEKVLELMMVSGIGTASGYEETISFSEIEVVDRSANSHSLVANSPVGQDINGWDVNVAAVRLESRRHHIRYHTHASYILRVKPQDKPEFHICRRYSDFVKLRSAIQLEFPARPLPPLPRKNAADQTVTGLTDDEDSSSSVFSRDSDLSEIPNHPASRLAEKPTHSTSRLSVHTIGRHHRKSSVSSFRSSRLSGESTTASSTTTVLVREPLRVSLRAFLRVLLQTDRIAECQPMVDFLTADPIELTDDDERDVRLRHRLDEKRLREHQQFYDSARLQAAELDREMEHFRRSIVQGDGLEKLFTALKEKGSIAELDPTHQTVAKWLRLEIAATLYHIFLAEDNSAEVFAQAKQIHKYIPYQLLSTIIRWASPATVMRGVVDVFLQRPLGSRSLFERIIEYALNGGISTMTATLKRLQPLIADDAVCERIKNYIDADEEVKDVIRKLAEDEKVDLLVVIVRADSGMLQPALETNQVERVRRAYDCWNNAVEKTDSESKPDVELFAHLKQFFKLSVRLRDKQMMMSLIRDEPTTIPLFQDLFHIFYNPLVLVYKSANVYNSITDFARFADDTIAVVEEAQSHGLSADPNQTVQSFINLCESHQDKFYKFVHEIYRNDNDLFTNLRLWFENILSFLRHGPKTGLKLDMNALLERAVEAGTVDKAVVLAEVDALIKWQMDRKRWHNDKTKQKMASGGNEKGTNGESDDVSSGNDFVTIRRDSGARSHHSRNHPAPPVGSRSAFVPALPPGESTSILFGTPPGGLTNGLTRADFGLDKAEFDELADDDDALGSDYDDDVDGDGFAYGDFGSESSIDLQEDVDPVTAERRRRARHRRMLRRTAGEPRKPTIVELAKLGPDFVASLRTVLAD